MRWGRGATVLGLSLFFGIGGCGDGGGAPTPSAVLSDPPPPAALAKKVLLLGIDGCRPDALELAATPNMDALRADGVYHDDGQATDTTWSGSGWSCILHGVWRDKHGVKDNSFAGANYGEYPDLFTRVEEKEPELATLRLTSWSKMHESMPTSADEALLTSGDAETTAQAVARLSDSTTETDLLFVYFLDVDSTGHAYGFHPTIPQYRSAIEKVDAQIGEVLAALKNRPTYAEEDWLIVATTDHGGTLSGHGKDGPEDRRIFFLVSGTAVQEKGGTPYPAPSQVDVVPTVLAHLGIEPQPSWGLDGKVVGLVPADTPPSLAYGINLLRHADAEWNRGFQGTLPNALVKHWSDAGAATVIPYGTPGFPSLADPGPADRGVNFYSGGASSLSAMSQRIDVTPLAGDIDLSKVSYTLSGFLGGVGAERDSAQVTARFIGSSRRAAFTAPNDKVYFFVGDQYYRISPSGYSVDAGYPKSIAAYWPGLDGFAGGAKDIDAAVHWRNGKIYFFKGTQYIRYDWANGKADTGYPKPIAGAWAGLENFKGGAQDLDAAVDWGNGNVYFFKGDEYVRYVKTLDKADKGYPQRISTQAWKEMAAWSGGIDAAVGWPTDDTRAYLFKQGSYVRWKKGSGLYNNTYPSPVDESTWPGLAPWSHQPNSLATIGPVTSTDRGNASGLLFRTISGTLPPGTRAIEVEVLFRRSDGVNNDGAADNLSFGLTLTD